RLPLASRRPHRYRGAARFRSGSGSFPADAAARQGSDRLGADRRCDVIAQFVDYGFMRRALVACLALGLGSAPIGVLLMLRRMSLVGDAMSHAILPGA